MFPRTCSSSSLPSGSLVPANGSKISTYGVKDVDLHFHDLVVRHSFLLADVPRLIFGSDFFAKQDLLIDVRNRQLVRFPHRNSPLLVLPAVPDSARRSDAVAGLHAKRSNPVELLLDQFPELLVSKFDSASVPAHGVQHVVPTEGQPVFARARRLDGDKLSVAKAEKNAHYGDNSALFLSLGIPAARRSQT